MKKHIFITLLCALLLGCSKEPMKIYPLTSETEIGHSISYIKEYFVISNHIEDKEALENLINEYNTQTLKKEDLNRYYNYTRVFYKESRNTPRNYKKVENDYFNNHTIEHFSQYLVYIISWKDRARRIYRSYYINGELQDGCEPPECQISSIDEN